MAKVFISLIVLFVVSACSTSINDGQTSLSAPMFVENEWEAKAYPSKGGDVAYCVVDGVHSNIRLVLEVYKGENEIKLFIESTRSMSPGVRFSVNSSDNSFTTSNKYLTDWQSKAIIDDLQNGQTIYLRWSEPRAGRGGRSNYTNLVRPDNFSAPYNECIAFMNKQVAAIK